jgi:glutamyl-tRNA reductase
LPTGEPLLVVDLGMPPNVDPSAVAIPGLELHGIEDMRCEAETNRRLRMAEMGRCEELLEHQLVILRRRLLDRALSPVAQGLRHSFEEIADRALHHAFSKDLSQLDEAERKAVRRCAEAMTKRLVQVPLRGLKGAAWHHSSAVIDNFIRGMESDDGKSPEE